MKMPTMKNFLNQLSKMDDWVKYLLGAVIAVLLMSLFYPCPSPMGIKLTPIRGGSNVNLVLENFDIEEAMSSDVPVIVLYSQNWCGHCKKIKPTWKTFSDEYKKIKIIEIDCGKYPDIAKKHNIKGYPTIKYHPKGINNPDYVPYQGDRTLQSLISFADSHS